jgi:hypothetical protein
MESVFIRSPIDNATKDLVNFHEIRPSYAFKEIRSLLLFLRQLLDAVLPSFLDNCSAVLTFYESRALSL